MKEVYVVAAVRTPVGKQKGYLREYKAPELLAASLKEAVQRIDMDPSLVDDVIVGCVYQVGEQGFNIARHGALEAGFPESVPALSMNRQCGSSLSAIQTAYAMVGSGMMDIVVAGGVELMSKYTIMSDINGTLYNGKPMGNPVTPFYKDKWGVPNQIASAQMVADKWNITREECWDFAVSSHQKAQAATEEGRFKNEIIAMKGLDKEGNEIKRVSDETIRPDTTREILQNLKVIDGTEWITAGISSTITDGSSAVTVMSGEKVRELNLAPLARIKANAVVGDDPKMMLTGPIPATPKVLEAANLTMDDIDIFEVNEAFAPVPLAWAKELGADMNKLNVNGGALALGHPVGNTGCRISVSAIHELIRRNGKYALVTLCTGGGLAPATVFERV